jgi:polar amino acid transport system substrate-binding protein
MTLFFRSAVHEVTAPFIEEQENSDSAPQTTGKMIIFFQEQRPYTITSKDGMRGLVATPVTMLFEKIGMSFSWERMVPKQQMIVIKENRMRGCGAGWFKTAEGELFGKYTLPVYKNKPFVAIARADITYLKDVETVDSLLSESKLRLLIKVGHPYGRKITRLLEDLTPWTVYTTADNRSMLKMIQTHRADYCFMSQEEAQDLMLFSGLNSEKFKLITLSDNPPGNSFYLLCSKQVKDDTIEKLNNAIRHFVNIQGNSQ